MESKDKGWGKVISNLDVKIIKGTHQTMFHGDNLKEIVSIIREDVSGHSF